MSLRILDSVGLTNLTDAQVSFYCEYTRKCYISRVDRGAYLPHERIISSSCDLMKLFITYICETATSIGLTVCFLVGAWATSHLFRWFDIPKFQWVLGLVELTLLVLGILMFLYSACIFSYGFIRDVWGHLFLKKSKPKGGSE